MSNKILIITGSAPCTMDDLTKAQAIIGDRPADYMAIGMDAVDLYVYPQLDYVATFHPADIPKIYEKREAAHGNTDFQIVLHVADSEGSQKKTPGGHIHVLKWWNPSGSSSLLGVQAGLEVLGYDKIIMCGCPLEGGNLKGDKYDQFRKGWEARTKEIAGKVKSMSGWTRDLTGEPTEEWLNGGKT